MIRKLSFLSVLLSALLLVSCQEDDFLEQQNKENEALKAQAPWKHEKLINQTFLANTKQEAYEIAKKIMNKKKQMVPGLGGSNFRIWALSTIVYNNTDKPLLLKRKMAWRHSFNLTGAPNNIPPKKYAIMISATDVSHTGVYDQFVYQYDNITTCFGSYLPFWFFGMNGTSNVLVNFSEFNNDELDYHSRPSMTKRIGNLEISGKITPLSYGPHYAEFTVTDLSSINSPTNRKDYIANSFEEAKKMINALKSAYGTGLTAKIIIHNDTDKDLIYKDRSSWYGSSFFSHQPSIIPARKFAVVLAQHKSGQATGVYNELTYKYGNQDVSFGTYVPWSWVYTNNVLVDFKEINYGNLRYHSTRPWIYRQAHGLGLTGSITTGDSPLVRFTVEKK